MKNTEKISKSFRTRYVKYGGYAAVLTIVLIAGLIGFNLVCQVIAPQFDLTQEKLFSLSEQSIQVAANLKTPVTMYCMWEPGKDVTQVKEIVDRYIAKSKNIRRQDIDPDRNPGFMLKYDKEKKGIEKGSVIVEGEKNFKVIRLQDMYEASVNPQNPQSAQITGMSIEKRITSALLYVSSGVTPVVYEITGHKEKPLAELGMEDLFKRENYTLEQLNLIKSDIPADAAALVINGPGADFTKAEADKLTAWLEKGGRLVALIDIQPGPTPNLDGVFASYGLKFEWGVVFEFNKNYMMGNNILYTVPDMNRHEILSPLLEKRSPVMLPLARGVASLDVKRQSTLQVPLLLTSQLSFLRTDLSKKTPDIVESDIKGPITLAMAVSEKTSGAETRIVAVGCGTLLEAMGGQVPGNIDMFMNSLSWIQDKPENISVRTKSLMANPMYLTQTYVIILGLLFVIVIPLAFFAAGFFTWLRRRHL